MQRRWQRRVERHNIKIYILICCPCIFPMEEEGRNCYNIILCDQLSLIPVTILFGGDVTRSELVLITLKVYRVKERILYILK